MSKEELETIAPGTPLFQFWPAVKKLECVYFNRKTPKACFYVMQQERGDFHRGDWKMVQHRVPSCFTDNYALTPVEAVRNARDKLTSIESVTVGTRDQEWTAEQINNCDRVLRQLGIED